MKHTLQQITARILDTAAAAPALWLLDRCYRSLPDCLQVLTYHRIGNPADYPEMDPDVFSARPKEFQRQMEWLAENYCPVSVQQVIAGVRGERPLPERAVLVTFDDAYVDFLEQAWPVMRSLGVPATLFVPTAFPDHPEREFWWDRLSRAIHSTSADCLPIGPWGTLQLDSHPSRQASFRRLKQLLKEQPHARAMEWIECLCAAIPRSPSPTASVLNWSQLRQLASDGVAIGVHTRNHPLLTQLEPELLSQEISGAWQDLKSRIDNALPVFAYPAGAVSEAAYAELKEAGFLLAFTTQSGMNYLRQHDPLLLHRMHVGLRTSCNVLRARLATVGAGSRFTTQRHFQRARRTTRVHPEASSVGPRVAGMQISTSE